MATPVAIKQIGQLPEAGRIRTGIKKGRAMQALDTFRFTSVDRDALDQLAAIYGGTVRKWEDAKANPPKQWEVITEASEIEVAIQPGSIDASYELWSGGGRQRSCDGELCQVTRSGRDDVTYDEEPCICAGQGVLECKPKTRVSVLIAEIHFGGTWRYESSGLNALHTLPSMLELIELLQSEVGMVPVTMALVPQTIRKGGQTRKFTIVQFRPKVSINEMLGGTGTYQAQVGAGSTEIQPSLPASVEPSSATEETVSVLTSTPPEPSSIDDEIVDAELVEDTPETMTKGEAMAYVKEHGGVMRKGTGSRWTVE